MKDRLIDTSLLVVLITVALVIVWTLFQPFGFLFTRNTRVNPATPIPTQEQRLDASNDLDIAPVIPSAMPNAFTDEAITQAEAQEGGITAIIPSPNAGQNASQNVNQGTVVEDSQPTVVPVEAVENSETPVEILAEGNIDLDRIGFSFVTGGAGACGIVLEPWRHVAVSRDILARYPCGTRISIRMDEMVAERQYFTAIVADSMNPSNTKTVNIYVGQEEPALQYGVQDGQLVPTN